MKKVLTLGITVLAGLTLTACGSNNTSNNQSSSSAITKKNMSDEQAELEYTKSAEQLAPVFQSIADSNLSLNDNVRLTARNADKKITIYNNKLVKYKHNANYKVIKKFNDSIATYLGDIEGKTVSSSYNTDIKEVSKTNKAAYSKLGIARNKKMSDAGNAMNAKIAELPGVSGKTIRTTNYTITITSTETTPHFEGGTDLIVYYTFKNTSKNKNIEPTESLIEGAHFTQESKTSINDLDLGNPSKDSDEWNSLEKSASQKVKPGAEVKCMGSYELDNTEYPVKIQATDPDNNDAKLGTITLELPNN
ncbi:DUF5067 domain-containing protein [Lactiplantibacillus plantarum]|uniref:DUF5067 domain-containing protein n=1 Tax=Lactiplantibacillus plantarum TaxID=1590 RepID=UPI0009766095|nr:DUF5067 domain-containing protein [Lactiplantibacillus plantarum]